MLVLRKELIIEGSGDIVKEEVGGLLGCSGQVPDVSQHSIWSSKYHRGSLLSREPGIATGHCRVLSSPLPK